MSWPACLQVVLTKEWGNENKRWKLFITRFFDCELCHGEGNTQAEMDKCHASMQEHFNFASCRMQRYVHLLARASRDYFVHA